MNSCRQYLVNCFLLLNCNILYLNNFLKAGLSARRVKCILNLSTLLELYK